MSSVGGLFIYLSIYLLIYLFSELHTCEREHEELRREHHPTSLHPPATKKAGSDRHLPRVAVAGLEPRPMGRKALPSTNVRPGRALLPPWLPLFPSLPTLHQIQTWHSIAQPFTCSGEAQPKSQMNSEIASAFNST